MSQAVNQVENPTTILTEFARFETFAKVMLDGYMLIDTQGRIVKANQALAQLTSLTTRQLLKIENIDLILSFWVDRVKIGFKELLEYESIIRIDEVTGKISGQEEAKNLLLGVHPFSDPVTKERLGVFVLIRDVTAETKLQDQYKAKAMQSITDPLTTLFTRAYFEEYLTGQVTRLESMPLADGYALSLVMCDIDFFKKINDGFGHQAGDYVLKVVSRIMKQTFRKTDVCCRYGGEEFLVILPAANVENAAAAANKLRVAIQNEVIMFEDKHIPVTMSCGVGTINIGKETYMETLGRADLALYECKHNGRNLVSLHDGEKIVITPRDSPA
ncbi:MAG: diguanylate cyclase [Proteobacteria bacterium]|nr:MAG: diguanylate cyclase [Pseudomonadota bacterium]